LSRLAAMRVKKNPRSSMMNTEQIWAVFNGLASKRYEEAKDETELESTLFTAL
jgi:hypothetical protein